MDNLTAKLQELSSVSSAAGTFYQTLQTNPSEDAIVSAGLALISSAGFTLSASFGASGKQLNLLSPINTLVGAVRVYDPTKPISQEEISAAVLLLAQVTGLNVNISDLKSKVGTTVNSVQSTLSAVLGQLNSLSGVLASTQTGVPSVDTALSQLQDSITSVVSSVTAATGTIQLPDSFEEIY